MFRKMTCLQRKMLICAVATGCGLPAMASPAWAENAPSAAEASPEIYKVVAEDENMRVLEATWQPGQKDAWHSHPPMTAYRVTDCEIRAFLADGTERDVTRKVGSASARSRIVKKHSVQNRGAHVCRMIITEIKQAIQ